MTDVRAPQAPVEILGQTPIASRRASAPQALIEFIQSTTPIPLGTLTVTQVGITVQRLHSDFVSTSHLQAVADPAVVTTKLQFSLNGTPAHGTLYLSGVAITTGATFTQADIDNDLLIYVQNGDTVTADSFPYTVSVLP